MVPLQEKEFYTILCVFLEAKKWASPLQCEGRAPCRSDFSRHCDHRPGRSNLREEGVCAAPDPLPEGILVGEAGQRTSRLEVCLRLIQS